MNFIIDTVGGWISYVSSKIIVVTDIEVEFDQNEKVRPFRSWIFKLSNVLNEHDVTRAAK